MMSNLAPYYHEKYNTKVFRIIKYWLKEVRVKDPCVHVRYCYSSSPSWSSAFISFPHFEIVSVVYNYRQKVKHDVVWLELQIPHSNIKLLKKKTSKYKTIDESHRGEFQQKTYSQYSNMYLPAIAKKRDLEELIVKLHKQMHFKRKLQKIRIGQKRNVTKDHREALNAILIWLRYKIWKRMMLTRFLVEFVLQSEIYSGR